MLVSCQKVYCILHTAYYQDNVYVVQQHTTQVIRSTERRIHVSAETPPNRATRDY
jgi:hypothetical protein